MSAVVRGIGLVLLLRVFPGADSGTRGTVLAFCCAEQGVLQVRIRRTLVWVPYGDRLLLLKIRGVAY
jgi:hypothetical protein